MPPGRWGAAKADHPNVIGPALGTRYFEIKWTDPQVGGPENVNLRKAILQAINRQEISDAVYDGTNPAATSVIPPGIPGSTDGICEYCVYDLDAAKEHLAAWKAAGNEQTEPIKIQLNADAGHEPVVNIMIDNLREAGIEAVADPRPGETYFSDLSDGACVICRAGWYADYPTADNFTYDLFHTDAIGGNNHGFYSTPEFDALIDEAKRTTDADAAARAVPGRRGHPPQPGRRRAAVPVLRPRLRLLGRPGEVPGQQARPHPVGAGGLQGLGGPIPTTKHGLGGRCGAPRDSSEDTAP